MPESPRNNCGAACGAAEPWRSPRAVARTASACPASSPRRGRSPAPRAHRIHDEIAIADRTAASEDDQVRVCSLNERCLDGANIVCDGWKRVDLAAVAVMTGGSVKRLTSWIWPGPSAVDRAPRPRCRWTPPRRGAAAGRQTVEAGGREHAHARRRQVVPFADAGARHGRDVVAAAPDVLAGRARVPGSRPCPLAAPARAFDHDDRVGTTGQRRSRGDLDAFASRGSALGAPRPCRSRPPAAAARGPVRCTRPCRSRGPRTRPSPRDRTAARRSTRERPRRTRGRPPAPAARARCASPAGLSRAVAQGPRDGDGVGEGAHEGHRARLAAPCAATRGARASPSPGAPRPRTRAAR